MTKQEQLQRLERVRAEYLAQMRLLHESFSKTRARAVYQAAVAANKELGSFSESIGEGLPVNTESLQMLEMKHGTQQ